MRIICKCMAVLFGVTALGLILYKTIVCGIDGGGIELCGFDITVAVVETSCTFHLKPPCAMIDVFLGDIIADSWLVGAPIHMVCRMKLPGRHLRMLVAIFALNILTSFASVAHSVLSLLRKSQASFIAGNAQVRFHFDFISL